MVYEQSSMHRYLQYLPQRSVEPAGQMRNLTNADNGALTIFNGQAPKSFLSLKFLIIPASFCFEWTDIIRVQASVKRAGITSDYIWELITSSRNFAPDLTDLCV